MQLIKSENTITSLMQFEDFSFYKELHCWIKDERDYNIYVFVIQLKGESELMKIKDDLRDCLAIYFQSQTLDKDVERWNIYQVFFVEEQISKDLKLQIEQDKFATRKLVFDNIGKKLNDVEIENKLGFAIFDFELSSNTKTKKPLEKLLERKELDLFHSIEEANGDIDKLLKKVENE
ncbi:MAG: hypothetical protein N4A49_01685 [Marinifilaceae bacterium]|jgi:hypothetical protein|nr:hypothetical protein [Marinifilaceae bacterium]